MIRVLLADDHAVVRQGLRTFLDLQEDIEVVAEAGDGEIAVDAAKRIKVKLAGDGERLFLKVSDDGCGFDPSGPEVRGQRLGLTSMEERAIEAGGSLTVRSERGLGTTVRLELAP